MAHLFFAVIQRDIIRVVHEIDMPFAQRGNALIKSACCFPGMVMEISKYHHQNKRDAPSGTR